jgi:hypothetical protein
MRAALKYMLAKSAARSQAEVPQLLVRWPRTA